MDWELIFWIVTCIISIAILWWINENFFKIVVGVVTIEECPEYRYLFVDPYTAAEDFIADALCPGINSASAVPGRPVVTVENFADLMAMEFEFSRFNFVTKNMEAFEPVARFAHTYLRLNLLRAAANERTLTYQGMGVFFIIVLLLCLVLQTVSHLRSLSTSQDIEKRSEYECGFAPFDSATRLPFDVHFYLVGILFLVFDVEVSLMFPWSVALFILGLGGVFVMLAFIYVLTVGFVYEWKRGALIWPAHYSLVQTSLANAKWCAALICTLFYSEEILNLFTSFDFAGLFLIATPLLSSNSNDRQPLEDKLKVAIETKIAANQSKIAAVANARTIVLANITLSETYPQYAATAKKAQELHDVEVRSRRAALAAALSATKASTVDALDARAVDDENRNRWVIMHYVDTVDERLDSIDGKERRANERLLAAENETSSLTNKAKEDAVAAITAECAAVDVVEELTPKEIARWFVASRQHHLHVLKQALIYRRWQRRIARHMARRYEATTRGSSALEAISVAKWELRGARERSNGAPEELISLLETAEKCLDRVRIYISGDPITGDHLVSVAIPLLLEWLANARRAAKLAIAAREAATPERMREMRDKPLFTRPRVTAADYLAAKNAAWKSAVIRAVKLKIPLNVLAELYHEKNLVIHIKCLSLVGPARTSLDKQELFACVCRAERLIRILDKTAVPSARWSAILERAELTAIESVSTLSAKEATRWVAFAEEEELPRLESAARARLDELSKPTKQFSSVIAACCLLNVVKPPDWVRHLMVLYDLFWSYGNIAPALTFSLAAFCWWLARRLSPEGRKDVLRKKKRPLRLAKLERKQRARDDLVPRVQPSAEVLAQLEKERLAKRAAEAAQLLAEQAAAEKAAEKAAAKAAERAAERAAEKAAEEPTDASAPAKAPTVERDWPLLRLLHKLRNPLHRLLGKNLTAIWPLTYLRPGEYGASQLKWSIVDAELDRKSRQKYDIHRLHPNQLLPLLPIIIVYAVTTVLVLALFCVAVDFAIGDMRVQLRSLVDLWFNANTRVHNFFVTNFEFVPSKGGILEGVLAFLILLPLSMCNVYWDYTRLFIVVVVIWTVFFWYFTASVTIRKLNYYLVWRSKQEELAEMEEERARIKRRELGAIHPDKGRKDFSYGLLLLSTSFDSSQLTICAIVTLVELLALLLGLLVAANYFSRFTSKSPNVIQNGHPVYLALALFIVLLVYFTPQPDYNHSFWKGQAWLGTFLMYVFAGYIYFARTLRLKKFLWLGLYVRTVAFMLLVGGISLLFATVYARAQALQESTSSVVLARPYTLQFSMPILPVCLVNAIWHEYQFDVFRGRLITPPVWYGRKYLYRYNNLAHDRYYMFREAMRYELPARIRERAPAARARRKARRLIPPSEAARTRGRAKAAVRAARAAAQAEREAKAVKAAKAAPSTSKSTKTTTPTTGGSAPNSLKYEQWRPNI